MDQRPSRTYSDYRQQAEAAWLADDAWTEAWFTLMAARTLPPAIAPADLSTMEARAAHQQRYWDRRGSIPEAEHCECCAGTGYSDVCELVPRMVCARCSGTGRRATA